MVDNFMKSRRILEKVITKYKSALPADCNELVLDPTGTQWEQLQHIHDLLSIFAGCIVASQEEGQCSWRKFPNPFGSWKRIVKVQSQFFIHFTR